MKDAIPSIEQIDRLRSLQGVDPGIFTLAAFSLMEAYLRDQLGSDVDNDTSFYSLLGQFRDQHPKSGGKASRLFRDIKDNRRCTNDVRHRFLPLSPDEANAAAYLLKEFADTYSIPNQDRIATLTRGLITWNNRKRPADAIRELEQANKEIQRLAKLNGDMEAQVSELASRQKDLELLDSKLKVLQLDYDQQIEKNRKNKEKIDELRQAKHKAEEENRKAQGEIREQLAKLSDAQDYIDQLSRMTSYTRTRYDYERGLVRLTKEQESIVEQVNFGRDFLVKGSAGTGKSLVLLKTLEKLLLRNRGQLFDEKLSVRLITFSKSLEKYNRYVADLMNILCPSADSTSVDTAGNGGAGSNGTDSAGANSGFRADEIITTSDAFILKLLKDAFPDVQPTYDKLNCLEDDPRVKDNPLGRELWTELDKFILPGVVSKGEYCDEMISRTGLKKAQNASNRRKIWEAVDAVFAEWENREARPIPYLTYRLLLRIADGSYSIPEALKVDYLFVDEAQDLTAAKLRLLRLSVRQSMILAGDGDQCIFQPAFTWSRAGIDVSGSTRTLHINFRSTDQINAAAEQYRALIHAADGDSRPETFRMGPPVELHEDSTQDASFQRMISTVRMCVDSLGYEPENICLIAPKKAHLEQLQAMLKDTLALEGATVNSSEFDFETPGIVRLSTIQSCKGLDFPVVLFYIDHRSRSLLEQLDEDVADRMNRSMIYTAMTRSIELLHVFMPETVSEGPLGDLKKILKGTADAPQGDAPQGDAP